MVARTTLEALGRDDAEVICVPAGSCATMMRVFWPELFHITGDHEAQQAAERLGPRLKEFSELVAGGATPGGSQKVAYHHSCHMLRELGLRDTPLEALKGHHVVDWQGDDRCCGFGGLFSVKQPETSVAMADDKIDALEPTGAEILVGCDQSCLMHLEGRMRRRGIDIPVRHLAEILDDG
jgi:L-lactate dehydrogenase complex protein LldE